MKWIKVIVLCGLILWGSQQIIIIGNATESLPQKYWIGIKRIKPTKGNYVVFSVDGQEFTFLKQVVGINGDVVSLKNKDFFVNDEYVATAKTHSLTGEPLEVGNDGVLGKGQYFVTTPYKHSFDSRYKKVGWVDEKQIICVVYPLW